MKKIDVIGLHENFFQQSGFELNKTHLVYEKSAVSGKQLIFINYSENENYRTLEYKLGIRIDSVEELVDKFLPKFGDFVERSMTIVQPLDKLGTHSLGNIVIPKGQDLKTTILEVESYFDENAYSWFEKMSDPQLLERNFLIQKNNPFSVQNFVYTAFRSTALSRLFNPHNYQFLRKLYLSQIHTKDMTPFSIASYLQFLNHLDHLKVA